MPQFGKEVRFMRSMMKTMEARLLAGEDLVLATVIAAHGATPRGAGARMLVNRDGRVCGTIGGGAVEYRSIQMAQDALEKQSSDIHDFTLNRNDVENLGMICGGDVRVFFHYIPAGDKQTIALAKEAEQLFQGGGSFWLCSDMAKGGELSLFTQETAPQWVLPHLGRHPLRVQEDSHDVFLEQIGTSGRVYIFGGGHVAQELEPMLSHVGFRCVVLEDRPEFADPKLFPTAEAIMLVDFNRLDDFITLHDEDYVCIMTRGHAYDTAIQAQVLRHSPYYVGVIGSRKKAAGVRQSLIDDYGLTPAQCDRVTTPIGLDIGGETPAEIAVSIAAQMIAVRAGK